MYIWYKVQTHWENKVSHETLSCITKVPMDNRYYQFLLIILDEILFLYLCGSEASQKLILRNNTEKMYLKRIIVLGHYKLKFCNNKQEMQIARALSPWNVLFSALHLLHCSLTNFPGGPPAGVSILFHSKAAPSDSPTYLYSIRDLGHKGGPGKGSFWKKPNYSRSQS